jgi:hypothetical protein
MDLFGPDGVTRASATRPAEPSNPAAADAYFADCIGGAPGTGTPIPAHWLNRMTMSMRRLVRLSRLADAYDDDLAAKAVRSQALNFVTADNVAGTGNAVTLAFNPPFASLADMVGVPIRYLVETSNTGALQVNPDGLGLRPVSWALDASALAAGESPAGTFAEMMYDGTRFQYLAHLSPSQVRAIQAAVSPVTFVGSFSQLVANSTTTDITSYAVIENNLVDTVRSGGVFTIGAATAGLWKVEFSVVSPSANVELLGTILDAATGGSNVGYMTSQTVTGAPGGTSVATIRRTAGQAIRCQVRQINGSAISLALSGRIAVSRVGA